MLELREMLEVLDDAQVRGRSDVIIQGIAYDSRQVMPGDLFVPWRGGRRFGDGHRFISQAVDRGAVAVVAARDGDFDLEATAARVPVVLVRDSRRALALLATRFYNFPSSRLRLIGITGTNGKTTTSHLIRSILEGHGIATGLIGTIHNIIGGQVIPAQRTTPQAPDIQGMLAQMADCGCRAAVMEVASIALIQERVTGCEFDVAVFTNISPEHLDDHGSWQNYVAAKQRLFQMLGSGPTGEHTTKLGPKYAVINADDAEGRSMCRACRVPVLTFAIESPADYQATEIQTDVDGTRFILRTRDSKLPVQMRLVGRFNVYNALAALAVAEGEGVPLEAAVDQLRRIEPVTGRFQPIQQGQDFLVIVDYAHTPDGLKNVLQAAREFTPGRLIVVFGCGGDRDPAKRPQMGAVAAGGADYVIITSDNPRSERPEAIIESIEQGIIDHFPDRPWKSIVDRRQAIFEAIFMAQPGDTVVIAGKGHETVQICGDREIPFNDRLVALEALQAVKSGGRG